VTLFYFVLGITIAYSLIAYALDRWPGDFDDDDEWF
jgi:hypothetical protein